MSASAPPQVEPWVRYIDEANKTGKLDNKAFWREVGTEYIRRYPVEAYRDMNQQTWQILKDNLAYRKIETVLDVGCGFGRMTNVMLTGGLLPAATKVVCLDLSEGMLKEARKIADRRHTSKMRYVCTDFETEDMFAMSNRLDLPSYYDLVISAEAMTSIPKSEEDRVGRFVNKMCMLSKKYVVNVDWYWDKEKGERKPQLPIYWINNYHWYNEHYGADPHLLNQGLERWKLKGYGTYVFVARMR